MTNQNQQQIENGVKDCLSTIVDMAETIGNLTLNQKTPIEIQPEGYFFSHHYENGELIGFTAHIKRFDGKCYEINVDREKK